jgi:hypothetical protein
MVDPEHVGKGDIQERNRTVVYLPREKLERDVLSGWWSSTACVVPNKLRLTCCQRQRLTCDYICAYTQT